MGKFMSATATAAALISKFGSQITLTRRTEGVFDPVNQTPAWSEQQFTFDAVAIPPTQQARYTVGTLEGKNALECYFSAQGQSITPAPGDRIAVGGVAYTIFWAQTYDPAADGAIFTLAYAERGS